MKLATKLVLIESCFPIALNLKPRLKFQTFIYLVWDFVNFFFF